MNCPSFKYSLEFLKIYVAANLCETSFVNELHRNHSSPKHFSLHSISDQFIMYHSLLLVLELLFHKFCPVLSALKDINEDLVNF